MLPVLVLVRKRLQSPVGPVLDGESAWSAGDLADLPSIDEACWNTATVEHSDSFGC